MGWTSRATYNNQGKYPIFLVNGCDAGNFFIYDPLRPSGQSMTLSETYDLASERGSSHFHCGDELPDRELCESLSDRGRIT